MKWLFPKLENDPQTQTWFHSAHSLPEREEEAGIVTPFYTWESANMKLYYSPHTLQNRIDWVLWSKYTPSNLLCISDHDIAKKLFLNDKCIFENLIVIGNNDHLSFRRHTL